MIGKISQRALEIKILDGLSGNTAGQHDQFISLSSEQADYSSLATFLITGVSIDNERAKRDKRTSGKGRKH